jgi:hypothetical protein
VDTISRFGSVDDTEGRDYPEQTLMHQLSKPIDENTFLKKANAILKMILNCILISIFFLEDPMEHPDQARKIDLFTDEC